MANLEKIVADKSVADAQWKQQRQAERENITAIQDAGLEEITTDPEAYARYLNMQGDNPAYSAGNIALVMVQGEGFTTFGTRERWKTLGRTVLDTEQKKGVTIFAKSPLSRGYTLAEAYDVKQTQGREMKQIRLYDNSQEMETALTAVLNYSVVPVVVDKELSVPAYYDPEQMELSVNPDFSDSEALSAITTEIAHARFHGKGANPSYNRADYELDAQSVSYILCRRFGISQDVPDLARLPELYRGWDIQDRRKALDSIQNMSKQFGGSIERNIAPQQRSRPPMRRAAR